MALHTYESLYFHLDKNPSATPLVLRLLAHVSGHTAGCTPMWACVKSATRLDGYSGFHAYKKVNLRMIITLLSAKGGVGKSTSAIHIATYLQSLAPTLLVDGDGIRSATKWSQRGDGKGLPFRVVSYAELAREAPKYQHIVIDTEGNPSDDDFRDATRGSDLVVVPAVPESVATDGLTETLSKLQDQGSTNYRVLLTMVPPKPRTEGKALREMLIEQKIPVFEGEIPRLAAFEKAAAEGLPVGAVQSDRNAGRAWAAYVAVGKEIIADGR